MLDVITIGTASRDVFLRSRAFRRIHDSRHLNKKQFPTGDAECLPLGGKIETDPPILTIGGGAANAAVTFARQGLKTGSLVSVGRDENGRAVIADLKKEKVKPFPAYDAHLPTASSVILLSPDGERTVLHYRGASMDLALNEVPWREVNSRWAYIVPGNIPFKVMNEIVRRLHAKGTRIAMNPSRFYLDMGMKKLAPILEKLSVGIFSREEATRLTHMAYDEEHQVFEKLHEALEGIVVMTDGPKGAWVSDCRRRYVAGVYPEHEVADRTGAGDAFGSGFVAGLILNGWADKVCDEGTVITRAIGLASANATSVVEHVGAQEGILKKKEFEKERRWRNFPITVKYLNSWSR